MFPAVKESHNRIEDAPKELTTENNIIKVKLRENDEERLGRTRTNNFGMKDARRN